MQLKLWVPTFLMMVWGITIPLYYIYFSLGFFFLFAAFEILSFISWKTQGKNICRFFGMRISPKIWNDAVVICPLATCSWFVHDRPQNAGLGHVLQGVRKMNISARFWLLQHMGAVGIWLCFASCSHAPISRQNSPLKVFACYTSSRADAKVCAQHTTGNKELQTAPISLLRVHWEWLTGLPSKAPWNVQHMETFLVTNGGLCFGQVAPEASPTLCLSLTQGWSLPRKLCLFPNSKHSRGGCNLQAPTLAKTSSCASACSSMRSQESTSCSAVS